jgi:N-acetylneuraminic acid mutarotase
VFGGGHHEGAVFNTVEAYDTGSDTWSGRANMPTARVFAAAATAPSGKIYVAGGSTSVDSSTALDAMEEYNPATNSWTTRAPMPTARLGLALVAAPNGKLYAIGGYSTSAQQALGFVEEYDPTTDQWTRRADMPSARTRFGAALGLDGKIYATGGDLGGFAPQPSLEVYDPIANTWTTRTPLPTARSDIAAATAGNGRIYVVGGFITQGELSLVEEYTPATDSWVRRDDMQDRRRVPGLVTGANGRLYAIGGFGGTAQFGTTLDTIEEGTPF